MTYAFRPVKISTALSGRDRTALALGALGLGAALYLWRRPCDTAAEPHEVVLARWEDEGGNPLPEDFEETTAAAASRLDALVEKGGAILGLAAEELRKAGSTDQAQALMKEGRKIAKRGLGETRKAIRKHPVAATAMGVAAGALGVALLSMMGGRKSE